MFRQAVRTMNRKKSRRSKITGLRKRLKQNLNSEQKGEVRVKLTREISAGLEAGGIPRDMIDKMTNYAVNLSEADVEMVHAETGESIILYLKCGSVGSLVRVKEMVLCGLLLRLLSEVIKQFIRSQPQIELVVRATDYNLTLFHLTTGAGTFVVIFSHFIAHVCVFSILKLKTVYGGTEVVILELPHFRDIASILLFYCKTRFAI